MSTNPEVPAAAQYDPNAYPQPSNPNAYQPLYNQPYAQPYPYQPYPQYQGQPYQGQPYGAPQYGGTYQAAYVVTPNTPTYCVEETQCKSSSASGIGWILFIVGFFVPVCWLFGSFFLCSSNPIDRRAGRANLVGFICLITFITVFLIATQT